MTDAAHTTDETGPAGGANPAHPPLPPRPAGAAAPGGGAGAGHPGGPAGAPAGTDGAGFAAGAGPAGPGHPPGPAGTAAMPAVAPPGADPYGGGPLGDGPGGDGPRGEGPYGGGPHGDSDRRPPKRKRRGRGLIITLVVLGGLFVGADRLAVNFAESKAADELKSREGLNITPEVSIKGFPFLTQAFGKELDEVEINLDGLVTDTGDGRRVTVTELRAVLHKVRIGGDFSSATADRASGRAHISYADLSAAAGPGIEVGYAGKSATGKSLVKITGKFMGLRVSANGTVSVVDGNTIRLRANAIPDSIPGKWEQQVRSRTDFDRKVDGLPSGMRLDGVESTPEGVDISIAGEQVSLAG